MGTKFSGKNQDSKLQISSRYCHNMGEISCIWLGFQLMRIGATRMPLHRIGTAECGIQLLPSCDSRRIGPPTYWTVILAVPLAQEPEEAVDALTVVVPAARSVANPGLEVENVRTEVLLDVHVALLVTSLLPLSVAVNWTVPFANSCVPVGVIVSVWVVPPVVLPVIEPLTPARVAETLTLEALPTAVTNPVELTVAQAVELCQFAELVTSLLPEP
jgi:hypothetical protein